MDERLERFLVGLVVGASLLLSFGYSLAPIFEPPDETHHYDYVRWLAQQGTLPNPYVEFGEYHQAPLYYLLATPLALPFREADYRGYRVADRNPYYDWEAMRQPYGPAVPLHDNRNIYVHPRAEVFPYTENALVRAVHVIRLLSVALSGCTVLASYGVFRLLWPQRPERRLAALGVVAFWPQFLYIASAISNDTLLYLLATVTLLLLLRQVHDGPSRRNALLLGLALGAAVLTKLTALALIVPLLAALLMDRRAWRYVPLTLAAALAVCGWWFARNLILYGDPTILSAHNAQWFTDLVRAGAVALDVGLTRLPIVYKTLWARFGHVGVFVGQPIYTCFDVLTALAAAGLAVKLARWARAARRGEADRTAIRQGLLIGVFALTWIGAVITTSGTAWSAAQGRFVLPGIAAWSAILVCGLDAWTPRRLRVRVALSGVAMMAALAVIGLFGYLLPAYQPQPLPATLEHPLSFRYGDAAALIGASADTLHARPGETVQLRLYWRASGPTAERLQVYLHSIGSDLVRRDSLPASGHRLSTEWQPGETWAGSYAITIPPDAEAQVVYPLVAGLYDPASGQTLPATDENDAPVTPVIGRLVINGDPAPFDPAYRFGGVIGLAEPEIARDGDSLNVCLRWVSLAATPVDYHVFVHLLAADGELLAQSDAPPRGGRYPTDVWTPGEVIEDCVALALPDGPANGGQIAVGLYDLDSGQHLAVQDREGRILENERRLLDLALE